MYNDKRENLCRWEKGYYKLDVIYSKSISNDVSVLSAEKITLLDMCRKTRYMDFLLLVGKIELSIQAAWM